MNKKLDVKTENSSDKTGPNPQSNKEDTKKAESTHTSKNQKLETKPGKKTEATNSEKSDPQKVATKSKQYKVKQDKDKHNTSQNKSEAPNKQNQKEPATDGNDKRTSYRESDIEIDEEEESWDVMLSYQWDYQKKVIKIKEELVKPKLKVWMDLECMEGKINRAMAKAIANSRIIVPCLSEKYEVSKNCRKEFIYAEELEQKMMFAKVQSGYNPTRGSDLGFILSDNL